MNISKKFYKVNKFIALCESNLHNNQVYKWLDMKIDNKHHEGDTSDIKIF